MAGATWPVGDVVVRRELLHGHVWCGFATYVVQDTDDLLALADAVREAARPAPAPVPLHSTDDPSRGAKRGHLRVLSSTD